MKQVLLAVLCASAAIAAVTRTKVKLPSSHADLARGEKLFQVTAPVPRAERRRRPRAHADSSEAVPRAR